MVVCNYCNTRSAVLKRPKTSEKICKECFFEQFELEVHETIVGNELFERGERVAIAASGGKDSTVLAHVLTTLNARYDYGLNLFLLSIDEGITGYRDDSLDSVKRNQSDYAIPLLIVGYKELYGWSMDEIVQSIGLNNNCTFCGVFRRQALDRGAVLLRADKICTGHNADDMAETVLMNLLRGDISRLQRCTHITTGHSSGGGASTSTLPRCKPFKYAYEKEIVMYAYYKRLDYFSTECIYSPNAYRGFARELLKELEKARSRCIVDIVRSGEHFLAKQEAHEDQVATAAAAPRSAAAAAASSASSASSASAGVAAASVAAGGRGGSKASTVSPRPAHVLGTCERCNYISSNRICKACVLLEGLNRSRPRIALDATATATAQGDADAATAAASRASTAPVGTYISDGSDADSMAGRVAAIQLQTQPSAATAATTTASSAANPSANPSAAAPAKPALSAAMDMAQKLNATSW